MVTDGSFSLRDFCAFLEVSGSSWFRVSPLNLDDEEEEKFSHWRKILSNNKAKKEYSKNVHQPFLKMALDVEQSFTISKKSKISIPAGELSLDCEVSSLEEELPKDLFKWAGKLTSKSLSDAKVLNFDDYTLFVGWLHNIKSEAILNNSIIDGFIGDMGLDINAVSDGVKSMFEQLAKKYGNKNPVPSKLINDFTWKFDQENKTSALRKKWMDRERENRELEDEERNDSTCHLVAAFAITKIFDAVVSPVCERDEVKVMRTVHTSFKNGEEEEVFIYLDYLISGKKYSKEEDYRDICIRDIRVKSTPKP